MRPIYKIQDITALEDFLPRQAVDEICVGGANDAMCSKWLGLLQIEIDEKYLDQFLSDQGIEDIDRLYLSSKYMYAIWFAAWNRYEREEAKA
jgi:hypothetical protein